MQHISTKVNDARCPCGQAACESKRLAMAKRREELMLLQELAFDEPCRNPRQFLNTEEMQQAA